MRVASHIYTRMRAFVTLFSLHQCMFLLLILFASYNRVKVSHLGSMHLFCYLHVLTG